MMVRQRTPKTQKSYNSTMQVIVILLSFFFLPLHAKTFQSIDDPILNSIADEVLNPKVKEYVSNNLNSAENTKDTPQNAFDQRFIKDIVQENLLKNVIGKTDWNLGSTMLSVLEQTLSDEGRVKSIVTDGLGLHADFTKTLMRLHNELEKIANTNPKDGDFTQNVMEVLQQDGKNGSVNINQQILNAMKNVFVGEHTNLSSIPLPTELITGLSESQNNQNMSASDAWMIVKSTWQRILAYVKEEHSIQRFMQLTPVKIIDKILSFGDDVSLAGFLAQKLHPDFAMFLADNISPHLGPLKDFDTFYEYAKEHSLDGIIDYLKSNQLANNINALSKFISAYFDDTFSDDVVEQYIAFISLNNTELYNFYKSIVSSQRVKTQDNEKSGRQKRDELNKAINAYNYEGYNLDAKDYKTLAEKILADRDDDYGGYGHSSGGYGGGYGHSGGYSSYGGGGGGYGGGGGSTTDPAVLLSSIALGALLGFLLFRLINGSRFFGKRDINDGSLSLWLSDLPEEQVPWGTNAERMKRDIPQNSPRSREEDMVEVPGYLRGEVWSSDPFIPDNAQPDNAEGDDMADHLNHLWMVYNETREADCVQSHLCDVVAKGTAEYLTGKESSIAILLASVSNMMGVPKAGQMVDNVIQTLVVGSHYACPVQSQCLQAFY